MVANFVMVAVWLLYFQLLYVAYRRQRQPKILINPSMEEGTGARCLIANMSPEPVFVDSIFVTVERSGMWHRAQLYDFDRADRKDTQSEHRFRQGPLGQGNFTDIGSFGQIIDEALGDNRHDANGPVELELTVIAIYGPEDLPVASTRKFTAGRDGIRPNDPGTRQIRSRRKRRRLQQNY